jgi:DNA-binding XRE family transcriptional regulator
MNEAESLNLPHLARRVVSAREFAGLTQSQLSRKVGFKDRQTLAAIEADQRHTPLGELKAPDPIDDRPSSSGAQRPARPGDPRNLCSTLSRPRRGSRYPTQREREEQCQSSKAVHGQRIAQQVGVPTLRKQKTLGFPRVFCYSAYNPFT